MFRQFEFISVGLATVIDVVLLLALLERRNRSRVAVPVALLVAGAAMLHGGAFVRLLLMDLRGLWAMQVHWCALVVLTTGLLLVPAAMTHCCWRMFRTGLTIDPPTSPRYVIAYLPILLLLPAAMAMRDDPRGDYLELMRTLVAPYTAWFVAVGIGSAAVFWRQRRLTAPRARQFAGSLAVVQLLAGAILAGVVVAAFAVAPENRPPLQLAALLVPLLPVLLFGYFVLRYNFMQLMLERTLVYAALLTAAMLFHHVAVLGLQNDLEDRYRVDFGIVEGLLIVVVVIAYQPLRHRASEALRYLLGVRVEETRRRMRDLAWRMAMRVEDDPQQLVAWFRQTAAETCDVASVSVWLFDETGRTTIAGNSSILTDNEARVLYQRLREADEQLATPRCLVGRLLEHDASLAVRLDRPTATGLVVFGRREANLEFSHEEANAIALVVEQLGIVLHNIALRTERLLAERRALQNEQLSTLGLLAGSIAHEIKNPLSSIKTLAAVMAEDLGPQSPHAEDVRLILGEVERLTTTTNQLLGFVRAPCPASDGCALRPLLENTLGVMRHWAHERGITIRATFDDGGACVAADEAALREVVFNLLKNAVEALERGGSVVVRTRVAGDDQVVLEIQDDGPGLAPEVQDRLFEPLVTTKPGGTGLGLYLVGREVRAAGGRIECRSGPGQGTLFTVALPKVGGAASSTGAADAAASSVAARNIVEIS
ncbi:MAG: hypothetical protein JNK76_09200 [Planctomycetales bacterium]|nr:hypothetical protein [Planctomycetales bacterium]